MKHTVYYSPDYVSRECDFDTTRKSAAVEQSLHRRPIEGVTLAVPEPATERQLLDVHTPDYVNAILSGHEKSSTSSGLSWCPNTYRSASAHAGGIAAAALDAMKNGVAGTLSSGLHHARADRGSGFCTFNGLVVAANAAYEAGARRVLILDLDAHCGGGTASLIDGLPWITHVDISVDAFDWHHQSSIVALAGDYLAEVSSRLTGTSYDLCLYNAGVDVHERDCGILNSEAICGREAMVFRWAAKSNTPIAYTLAGGYAGPGHEAETVVELHRNTILAAAITPRNTHDDQAGKKAFAASHD
jgi:acetoin utilization deacetylase AcuC-like enzyme